MKKWLPLLILAALVGAGCDDSATEGQSAPPRLAGVWDFTLTSTPAGPKDYTVTVERGGISGVALVSITGPLYADTATVTANAPLPVGGCGVTVTFGNTAGFTLAAGDFWRITILDSVPLLPLPGNTVDSVVGPVLALGLDSCPLTICDGSALGAAVPGPSRGLTGLGQGSQWLSVRLAQSGAQVTAAIPEEHVMSLYLGTVIVLTPAPVVLPPLVFPGDTVTVSYRRALDTDAAGGDFFRVVVLNGPDQTDAEYSFGPAAASASTVESVTFTALSTEVRLDFIGGLSGASDQALLDDVQVSTPAGPLLTEGFETGPGPGCEPAGPNALRFEPRSPDWAVGSLCVSANGALSGTYSGRWQGGSSRQFQGSIITGDAVSGIGGLLGDLGGLGGLLGLGGVSGLTGLFSEVWEPTYTGYLTVLSSAAPRQGTLAGTFKGESRDHVCVEQGELAGAVHRNRETDLASAYWELRIEGEGVNCLPALVIGDTLAFGDTLSTLSGETIRMIQIGAAVAAVETPLDNYGNAYRLSGLVGGGMVTVTLAATNGQTSAAGLGVVNGNQIRGSLAGRLRFDGGRVCDLARGASFRVTLAP